MALGNEFRFTRIKADGERKVLSEVRFSNYPTDEILRVMAKEYKRKEGGIKIAVQNIDLTPAPLHVMMVE